MTLGEVLLSLYALTTVIVAWSKGNLYAVPFLLLYLGGFGYVAALGLRTRIRKIGGSTGQERAQSKWAEIHPRA
jgi:hypothetical protein